MRIFICGRKPERCKCGRLAHDECDYPLSGVRSGETCSRKLCDRCAVTMETPTLGAVTLCGAHARMVERIDG